MSTITAHISRGAARRTLAAGVVAAVSVTSGFVVSTASAVAASTQVSAGYSYQWPVKPFDRQHPVRGFFGDPRVGRGPDGIQSRQFHFGVDVSAPNSTAVYATLSGRIAIHPDHSDVVLIDGLSGVEFQYWHIAPTVHTGEHAVAYKTVIGHIESPWAHVHFSELQGGRFVNPLRPGAMGPYADSTRPSVSAVELERSGDNAHVAPAAVAGRIDIVADVADETPMPVAKPWAAMPVMPSVVRWRLVGPGGAATRWQTAFDVRQTIPSASEFSYVFARWTRQNHPNHPGRYRLFLAHGWDCGQVRPGSYRIEVAASDTRGNTTVADFPIRVMAA